jgi:hypothetical protein
MHLLPYRTCYNARIESFLYSDLGLDLANPGLGIQVLLQYTFGVNDFKFFSSITTCVVR